MNAADCLSLEAMPNDHDDKAEDGQQRGAAFPGDGAIERTGEPLPADVVAAASAAAEAVAAATAASVAAGSTGNRAVIVPSSPRPRRPLARRPRPPDRDPDRAGLCACRGPARRSRTDRAAHGATARATARAAG